MTRTSQPLCVCLFVLVFAGASKVRAEGPEQPNVQGSVYVTPPAVAPVYVTPAVAPVVVTPPAVAPVAVNAQATVSIPRPRLEDLDVTFEPAWRPTFSVGLGGGARIGDGATATGSFAFSAGIDYDFIVEPRVSYVATFDQVGEDRAPAVSTGDDSRWSATHALMGGVRLKLDRVGPSLHLDLDAGYSFNAGPFGADLPDGAVARAGLGWRWYVDCEDSDESIELGVDALFGLMDNRANDAIVARVGFNYSTGSSNARSTWQCRESMRRREEREAAEAESAAQIHANAGADLEGRAELIARLDAQAPRPVVVEVTPPSTSAQVNVTPVPNMPPSPYGTPVYVSGSATPTVTPPVRTEPSEPWEPSQPSRARFIFGASTVFGIGLSDDGLLGAAEGSAVGGGFALGFSTSPWYEVRAEYLAYNRNDKPHDAGVHTTSIVGRLNLTEVAPMYIDAGLGWAFVNANEEVGESDNGAVARVGLGYVARMGCSDGTDFGLTFGAEGHAGLMGNRAADAFLLRTGFEIGAGSSANPRCVEAQETSGLRLVLGGYTVGGVTPTASATHGAGAGAFGIGATFGIGLSSWIEARLNAEAGWRFDENTLSSFDPSLTARIGLDSVAPVYVEAGFGFSSNAEKDGPFARFGVGYRRFTGCGNGFEGVLTAGVEGRVGLVDNRVSDAVLATLGIDLNIGSGVTSGGSWQCYESPEEYAERVRREDQERAEDAARARVEAEARARVAASSPRVSTTQVEVVRPSAPRVSTTQVEVIGPRAPSADFRADVRSDVDAAVEVELAAEPTVSWDLSLNVLGGLALSADGEVPGILAVFGGGVGAGIRVAPWFEPRIEFDVIGRTGMPKDTSSGVVTPSLVTRFDLGTVAPIYIDAGLGYGIAYAGGITTPESGLVARFGVGYRRYLGCGTNDSSFRIGVEGRAGLMENRNADMVLVSAAFDFGFGKVRSAETAQCRAAARAAAYGTVEVRSPSPEEVRRTQEAIDTAARGAQTVRSVLEGGGRVDVRVDVQAAPPPPPSR